MKRDESVQGLKTNLARPPSGARFLDFVNLLDALPET